ncbi:NADH-quinone oxidoreductase subunit C, partial [Streptomyces sp. AC627_RSS907]|uniref:NADH-quinone oxidoreductase subunit C n=1 Tax=Streptomyces sp. AC627_RSS907 TaxID=2823684 RepID=UPI001C229703
MTEVGWLPAGAEELFGAEATAEESYDVLTVDVPPAFWISALETARDRLGCTYFDWLSAVDEPGTGFRVAAHVVALGPVRRLLLRTTVPHEAPVLPTAVAVYAGAAWHERETHEMFGVLFQDHPALDHLLLPEGFEGHPLRKDFVLAARVAKAWPGAKEPGESDHGGPRRRQMLPPGVPDPNEWGPLKGQLPPAPARGAGRTAGERPARATGERPRRARTATEGSVSQTAPGTDAPSAPRRSRTAAEGSASQTSPAAGPTAAPAPRRARSASGGSASQRTSTPKSETSTPETPKPETPKPETPMSGSPTSETPSPGTPTGETPAAGHRRTRSASQGSASQRSASDAGRPGSPGTGPAARGGGDDMAASSRTEEPASTAAPSAPRSPDAPWHHARPAFEEPAGSEPGRGTERRPDEAQDAKAEPGRGREPGPGRESGPRREPEPASASEPRREPEPGHDSEPTPTPSPTPTPEAAEATEPTEPQSEPDTPDGSGTPDDPGTPDTPDGSG